MQLMAPLSVRWQRLRNHFLPAVIAVVDGGVLTGSLTGSLPGSLTGASPATAGTDPHQATIAAVDAENQYANVISRIGSRYVSALQLAVTRGISTVRL